MKHHKRHKWQKRASLKAVIAALAIAYCSEAVGSVLAKLQHDDIVWLIQGFIQAAVKVGTVVVCLLL
ncbi:hypothetical protein SAMN05446935_8481 [Burkholderia sp. YR290]|nr:hypothetical protein SAMN05446935_8481 [Burkholderia sp. YR290]